MGILSVQDVFSQEVKMNMTRDEFVSVFGSPSHETFYDTDDTGRTYMLFYGDDFFSFTKDRLTLLNVMSEGFALSVNNSASITVGDRFSEICQNTECRFEQVVSYGKYDNYHCTIEDGKIDVQLYVSEDIVKNFTVEKKSPDGSVSREFRAFFESVFQPVSEVPENSLWPAGIDPLWKQAAYMVSKDKGSITCCVPFVPELNTSAKYSGEDCPDIGRRLVITKLLDDSSRFKQSVVSVVPKAGLSAGDEFTGLVVYNNVNTGSCFAWECYEGGRLVYSKFPSQNAQAAVSSLNIGLRLTHKLYYAGGGGVISDSDWAFITANRTDVTQAYSQLFPPGRTQESVMAEKRKYSFISVLNPEFSMEEEQEEMGREVAFQEQDMPESREVSPADTVPLPTYFGKADNLSAILRLSQSPLTLDYETRESKMEPKEDKTVVICTNIDYCPYTIKTDDGKIIRVNPGKKDMDNGHWNPQRSFRYYYFRGNAISNVDYKFPYALPVASGTKVTLIPDERERYRSFAVLMNVGDPVYAMRGGRVCLTDDERSVLICHEDGTFAAYMNVDDACVSAGGYVHPGDRIGICGGGKLSVSIFYLDANKLGGTYGSNYTHLTPYIRTAGGDVKLETGVEYISVIDADIITKEMGALQKKKYLKEHAK